MQELGIHTLSVGELAQALDIPMSTAALSVKILEEAGIITTETQPGRARRRQAVQPPAGYARHHPRAGG